MRVLTITGVMGKIKTPCMAGDLATGRTLTGGGVGCWTVKEEETGMLWEEVANHFSFSVSLHPSLCLSIPSFHSVSVSGSFSPPLTFSHPIFHWELSLTELKFP